MVSNEKHACPTWNFHNRSNHSPQKEFFLKKKFLRAEGDGESEVRVPSKKKREQEAAAKKLQDQEEQEEQEPPSKTPVSKESTPARATSPSSTVVSTEVEGEEEERPRAAKPVASSRYKGFGNFDQVNSRVACGE